MRQVDTISAGLMPQLLQNAEHLVTFVTKFGFKVRDINTGKLSFEYYIVDTRQKILDETPSTSEQNWYKSKIITGDFDSVSISSEDTNFTETGSTFSTPQKNGKVITKNSPVTG